LTKFIGGVIINIESEREDGSMEIDYPYYNKLKIKYAVLEV